MATINKDGFVCGENIKNGSINVTKINTNDLSTYINNYFTDTVNEEWLRELIKETLEKIGTFDEEWLKKFICSFNCASAHEFYVIPTTLNFEAAGGSQSFTIYCGATDEWEIIK